MNNKNLSVTVCVITYNQSKYIIDCLKSIAAQKCSYPFNVIIRDDASTDGTNDLISEFISKNSLSNFLLYKVKQNEGMMLNFLNAINLCEGDFIAFCEGDDFWVDDFKLEKQVKLMRLNPGCSISVHPCYVYRTNIDNKKVRFYKGDRVKKFGITDVLSNSGQSSPSASYMIKKEFIDILPSWFINAPVGDLFIELYSMKLGYGLYMPDIMCSYRIYSENSWTNMMQKKGGLNLIHHGSEMNKYISYVEKDNFFDNSNFNIIKSSALFTIAIGYLLEKNFNKFKENIIKSHAIYPNSSTTQKWMFNLRSAPALLLFLFKAKNFYDRRAYLHPFF